MSDVVLSQAEIDAIEVLADYLPEPGSRCPTCNRRVNKPRQSESPDTKEIRLRLPAERAEWAEDAFDGLQQVVGADPYSYPRGRIFEALLVLGGQHREQLRELFQESE